MNFISRFFCLGVLFLLCTSNARALLYWDINGNTPGSGSSAPSGTWSLSGANWSTDDSGTNAAGWVNGDIAAFSAGSDAIGSYTITVDNSGGQVIVADMHCDDGNPTITGNPLKWNSPGQLISTVPGHTFTINCLLTNDSTDSEAFHKYKLGTLVLGGSNGFHGSVSIEGGTIILGNNQRLPSSCNLVLTNGDDRGSDGFVDTPATFNTGGFNQSLGTLLLTGPNTLIPRTIDFTNGQGTLSFANSSSNTWFTTANANNSANPGPLTLTVTNFSRSARLRFGTNSSGLTSTQLSQIKFADYVNLPGVIDANGLVTPALPVFQSAAIVGTNLHVSWSDVPNRTYRLLYRGDMSSPWQTNGDYTTNGTTITVIDTLVPQARYYRVQVLP